MPDYIELDELKQYLGITSDNDDPLLTACLEASTQRIDNQFSASWQAETLTRYYQDCDTEGDTLHLDRPLLSVTTLTNGDTTEITSDQYWLMPRNNDGVIRPYNSIKLKSGYAWQYDQDGWISVAGSWGYTLEAPGTIKQASLRLSSYFYRIKDNQTFGRTAQVDLGLIQFPATMPPDVDEILESLRLSYDFAGWGY